MAKRRTKSKAELDAEYARILAEHIYSLDLPSEAAYLRWCAERAQVHRIIQFLPVLHGLKPARF